jgi:NAD(P)-dependent dehydrogenase (short-subunit alcohol dehydrogenase family)
MGLLRSKTALVTGASRGIGKGIATAFGKEGALVAVHYGRSVAEANAVVAEIEAAGGNAFAVQADVASVASVKGLFTQLDSELEKRTGSNQFDILVNNAGVYVQGPTPDLTEEHFDHLFDINVKGLYFTTVNAIPRLRDNGRIINISSGVSRGALQGVVAYAGTKGAVDAITLHLAAELGSRGITVNSLAPGLTLTEMTAGFGEEGMNQFVNAYQSIKRIGQVEDISNTAVLLASDKAAWITGNYISAGGGFKL